MSLRVLVADEHDPGVVILNMHAETHRGNLMQKLNLHNTAEIVLYAVRKGIIV